MDINYKKHFQHGVEVRFFDWFPEKRLEELLNILVCVADASYHLPLAPPAPLQESWNNCVIEIMRGGIQYNLQLSERAAYEKHFKVELFKENVKDLWKEICKELLKYKNGSVAKLFLR
jgi:hypothetical protein